MLKYYCLDGQAAFVRDCPDNKDNIIIRYKGKEYVRPQNIIGKKLFKNKQLASVHVGDYVLAVDFSTGEKNTFFLCESHIEKRYVGMGGSFYGARVQLTEVSDGGKVDNDNSIYVSDASPIGRAFLGHFIGDRVYVELPDNESEEYQIIDITKP